MIIPYLRASRKLFRPTMLRRISQQQFLHNLRARGLEDLSTIKLIETSLKKQRGYIFHQPAKGDSVVLLLSGGLDSVTCWGILMEEFGLHVYPISFDRGEKRAPKEKKSIDYYSKIYQHRYPDFYHDPIRLSLNVDPMRVQIEQVMEQLHPEIVLKNFDGNERLLSINPSFGAFLLLPVYAKIYAEYLLHTKNIAINTIYCSVTTGDGLLVPHQTFTALRSIMFYLCSASGDFSWQFTSVVFEKENRVFFDKCDLVAWATKHSLPLERTWSCYYSKKYQCGGSDCQTCVARRDAFEKAGMQDKTTYRPVAEQSLSGMIKYRMPRLFQKLVKLKIYL